MMLTFFMLMFTIGISLRAINRQPKEIKYLPQGLLDAMFHWRMIGLVMYMMGLGLTAAQIITLAQAQ